MKKNSKEVHIYKSSGLKVPFNSGKLKQSLLKAGADYAQADRIVVQIEEMLFDGVSTKDIYTKAFSLLRKKARHTAARYKLRNAITELGPTGYPFEQYIGKIIEYLGFEVQVGVIVKGHCVNHEVDVFAENEEKQIIVECKFHSRKNRNCDIKVPLYIQSRFKDIEQELLKSEKQEDKSYEGWIVTNTRFTSDAIQYGTCMNLKLISWNYPVNGSLNELIDDSGLYPITCLTTLTKKEKQELLSKGKVLCRELCNYPKLLMSIGVSEKRHKKILNEADDLCSFTECAE